MADDIEDQDFKYLEGLIKKMDEKLTRAIQEVREEQARTSGSMDEIKKMIQGLISSKHEVNVPSHLAAVNRNDGILGSCDSSMVHASNEFSMRANSYAKIEFPRFDGSCITEWLYKADQFFEIDHTNEWNKEKIASLHLDGKALHWYKAFLETKQKDKAISWKEFVTAATDRFGELLILDPVSELKNLKQKESLQQHLEEFNYAKLEPIVVLKDDIYTMYHEALKILQPSLMKSVDAPQLFEEIPQWEFVPWNAKIGTEFESLEKVTHVYQSVCTQILVFDSGISGWKQELHPDVMPWRPDSLTISLIEGNNTDDAVVLPVTSTTHNGQLQKVLTVIGKFYSCSIAIEMIRDVIITPPVVEYTSSLVPWLLEVVEMKEILLLHVHVATNWSLAYCSHSTTLLRNWNGTLKLSCQAAL